MYPANEMLATLASVAFLNSLQDPNMLQPTGGALAGQPLFARGVFDIRLGGDEGMIASTRTITVPIPATIIAIGRPYGVECGYTVGDPSSASNFYSDQDIWIPFTVWDNAGADQDDTERLLFHARDKRQNVFSAHGLNIQVSGQVGAKPRPTSPITGLACTDYRWRFFFYRN